MTGQPLTDKPRSAMPDLLLPAFFSPDTAQVIALYRQLDAWQWRPADEIERGQFRQLARLIAHARAFSPHYRETLALVPDAFGWAEWREVPLLSGQRLQSEAQRLRSTRPPSHGEIIGAMAGGAEILQTTAWWLLAYAVSLRFTDWHGYDVDRKLVEIRPFGAGHRSGAERHSPRWDEPHGSIFATGELVLFDGLAGVDEQLAMLEREAPHYLHIPSESLRLLLRGYRRTGRRLPGLRLVRTEGEPVDPDLRAECQAVLGAPLVDTYRTIECGAIALQCPEHEHYHVQSEMNLVEVLGEDGRPCAPGETGRVVVTPLHAFAMPLFRYELGDLAEVGAPCPCGRGLPVLNRIWSGAGRA